MNQDRREPFYSLVATVLGWGLNLMVSHEWFNQEKIPKSGGLIVVANHISYFDPPTLNHYLLSAGRTPRFLAKAELFKVPFLGWLGRQTGQIPVFRNTDKAKDSLVHAEQALRNGKCITMYPEGTVTADPETWPMTCRPGAVRLALRTGCPIVPVGQWGANFVMPGKRPSFPKLFPRRTMKIMAGDPIKLDDLVDNPDAEKIAIHRVETALTQLVSQLRGEPAPENRYDIRLGRRV